MSTSRERVRVHRAQEGDTWMTPVEVCAMFKITKNQLYKYNQTDIPYHRLGKVCRYLYSEVMNWAMNKDVAIVDEPERHRILGLGELPRCWPPEVWPELPNTEN